MLLAKILADTRLVFPVFIRVPTQPLPLANRPNWTFAQHPSRIFQTGKKHFPRRRSFFGAWR